MNVFFVEEALLSDVGLALRGVLLEQLQDVGHEVAGPWCLPAHELDHTAGIRKRYFFHNWNMVSESLIVANYRQINAADAIVCLCDAPIGPVVGAAMGYAFALSKPIFVYRSNCELAERIELPFDVQADFMCDKSGGLVTNSVAAIVREIGLLATQRGLSKVN